VAAVLGIIQQPGTSVSESVAAALEGRIRLLVIDNCEHVLDAAADLIEAILAQVTHEMPCRVTSSVSNVDLPRSVGRAVWTNLRVVRKP
jgi:predicted ATPase